MASHLSKLGIQYLRKFRRSPGRRPLTSASACYEQRCSTMFSCPRDGGTEPSPRTRLCTRIGCGRGQMPSPNLGMRKGIHELVRQTLTGARPGASETPGPRWPVRVSRNQNWRWGYGPPRPGPSASHDRSKIGLSSQSATAARPGGALGMPLRRPRRAFAGTTHSANYVPTALRPRPNSQEL